MNNDVEQETKPNNNQNTKYMYKIKSNNTNNPNKPCKNYIETSKDVPLKRGYSIICDIDNTTEIVSIVLFGEKYDYCYNRGYYFYTIK